MTEAKDPLLQPHPFAKQARRLWFVSVVLVVCAVAIGLVGQVAWTILFAVVGVFTGYRAFRLPTAMRVVQTINHSLALQLAGRYAEAEKLLDQTEPLARGRYVKRVFPAHRAQMALDRGDLEGVERQATLALALPPRSWTRAAERVHMAGAQANRALARALAGNDAGALEDAAAVESYDETSAGNLGRALLARLAVSARAGDRESLRALCRKGAGMPAVAELRPRERAMFRSYRRLAFAPGDGAYREASNPGADQDTSPEAELFRARDAKEPEEPAIAPLSPEQRAELERLTQERKEAGVRQTRKVRRRSIGIGVVIGLAALVPLFLLAPPVRKTARRARTTESSVVADNSSLPSNVAGLVVVLVTLLVAGRVVMGRREGRILLRAHKAYAQGDGPALEPLVERLRKSRLSAVRAQGNLLAADRAFAAADFATALARADDAMLAMASEQLRALHADLLVPAISAQRAVALAALGRIDAARIEHAALLQACPTFAYRGSVAHRVDLLSAVSSGAWAEARALASRRPDGAPIPIREETLGDLARMEEAASDVERRRIRDELAENPALSHWIAAVAPGLIERVTGSLAEA